MLVLLVDLQGNKIPVDLALAAGILPVEAYPDTLDHLVKAERHFSLKSGPYMIFRKGITR